MVFEFVLPLGKNRNGFSQYVESLTPTLGLELVEHCSAATVVEGDWEPAMSFLHQCQEYVLEHNIDAGGITTIHIHS